MEDQERVSSTTLSYCHPVCDSKCNNLNHQPNYELVMLTQFTRFNPNPNCERCFPAFLVACVQLLLAICKDTRRSIILCDTFVSLCKSMYRPAIKNYITCLNSHENPPPYCFCSRCFRELLQDILVTYNQYEVLYVENVPSASAEFFVKFLNILSTCEHGCPQVIGS